MVDPWKVHPAGAWSRTYVKGKFDEWATRIRVAKRQASEERKLLNAKKRGHKLRKDALTREARRENQHIICSPLIGTSYLLI